MDRVDLDRDPVVVFWEITLACALSCRHCRAQAQHKRHPLELSTDEGMRVLEELARFDHPPIVVLSGGDPFMRRDLFDFVERGIELGLTMSVSPSATALVTKDRLGRLKQLGVHRISLSLDGSRAELHDAFRGVSGSFDRTLAAMRDAAEVGLSFQINTTVTRQTVGDLPSIAELLTGYKAAMWDVFMLVPTGRALAEDAITPQEHEEVFNWLCEVAGRVPFMVKTTLGQHHRRVQVLRRLAAGGATSLPGRDAIKGMYRGVPSNDGKGILFISHLGEVFPSGFLPVSGGNVRRQSVVGIYREAQIFRDLRDPSKLKGKCGVCPFNVVCGGCRARAYAVTGDPLESEPFCVFQPPGAAASAAVQSSEAVRS